MLKTLVVLSLVFINCNTFAAVWDTKNQWSPNWEKKYSYWVKTSWHKDLFSQKTLPSGSANPYYGLRMDCADTVYIMRALFSFENNLPFAVNDPTQPQRVITNEMSRWDTHPSLHRFRSFIWYLFGILGTATLPFDTYPVALNAQAIQPGQLILTTKKNHHAWTIKDILPIGVPWLVFNSRLGASKNLTLMERKSWPNAHWVFEGDHSPKGNAGIRAFKTTTDILKPASQVTGYSEEQYNTPLKYWNQTAKNRLAKMDESPTQELERLLTVTCEGIAARVKAVDDALSFYALNPTCMNYETYDNFSTPNRDRRLFDDLVALRESFARHLASNAKIDPNFAQQLLKVFKAPHLNLFEEHLLMLPSKIDELSLCPFKYHPTKAIDLAEFKRRLFAGLISNNPMDPITARWGETEAKNNTNCPRWDPYQPDLLNHEP